MKIKQIRATGPLSVEVVDTYINPKFVTAVITPTLHNEASGLVEKYESMGIKSVVFLLSGGKVYSTESVEDILANMGRGEK